jgi:hypothetical protein
MIEFVGDQVCKSVVVYVNDVIIYVSLNQNRGTQTDFDVYCIGIQIIFPKSCKISKFFHGAHISKGIPTRITPNNGLEKLRIFASSNLRNEMYSIQYTT